MQLGATSAVINWNPNELPLTAPKNRPHPNSSWASQVLGRQTVSTYIEANVPLCQGNAKRWALLQALGIGEHLGWPLSRALRVDVEMPKRLVSEIEPMYTVQFSTSICAFQISWALFGEHFFEHGSDTVPARCDGSLSQAYRCRLGDPGLSLDIRHCRWSC